MNARLAAALRLILPWLSRVAPTAFLERVVLALARLVRVLLARREVLRPDEDRETPRESPLRNPPPREPPARASEGTASTMERSNGLSVMGDLRRSRHYIFASIGDHDDPCDRRRDDERQGYD
jgi:hypothetical protein